MEGITEQDPNVDEGVYKPSIDLEWYSNNYIGLTGIRRLEYVADNFASMRTEALMLALTKLKDTYNVQLYKKLYEKLTGTITEDDYTESTVESFNHILHPTSLASKNREFALKTDELLNNLRMYKANNIKESVRTVYNDLGDHHLDAGELNSALGYYGHAWYYCSTEQHIINTCINKIKVVLLMNRWNSVLSYISTAQHVNGFNEVIEMNKPLQPQLKCAAGIAELGLKNYKSAALNFLHIDIDNFCFPDMISSNNIATYTGLCGLATFDRADLHKYFIQNGPFKAFLELEPEVRDIINNFYTSKYSLCLKKLSELKANLLVDMYFAPHVDHIFKEIRVRGILQYFSTYSRADMVKMADAFNTPYNDFREELIDLIFHDKLAARIDSVKKLLVANEPDYEAETYERVLRECDRFERTAKTIMIHALFKEHNVLVQ